MSNTSPIAPEATRDPGRLRDLLNYIRWYDQAVSAESCARLIETFEQRRDLQAENGAGARSGLELSRWTEMNLIRLGDATLERYFVDSVAYYKRRYEVDCGLPQPLPDPSRLAPPMLKRYRPGGGEAFQAHFDSVREHCNRYLVFLWYLNDVAAGGETRFIDLDHQVAPAAGRLLVFPPYWTYVHAGLPPVSGPKYILSTYLLW
jgi:hypothetical protein